MSPDDYFDKADEVESLEASILGAIPEDISDNFVALAALSKVLCEYAHKENMREEFVLQAMLKIFRHVGELRGCERNDVRQSN